MAIFDDCLSNEIYRIKASQSKLFNEFVGRSFGEAAYAAIPKQVCLFAVKSKDGKLLLNPGSKYILVCARLLAFVSIASSLSHCQQDDDICYYIARSPEDYIVVTPKDDEDTSVFAVNILVMHCAYLLSLSYAQTFVNVVNTIQNGVMEVIDTMFVIDKRILYVCLFDWSQPSAIGQA